MIYQWWPGIQPMTSASTAVPTTNPYEPGIQRRRTLDHTQAEMFPQLSQLPAWASPATSRNQARALEMSLNG